MNFQKLIELREDSSLKQKDIAWAFLNHDVGYAELDNFN